MRMRFFGAATVLAAVLTIPARGQSGGTPPDTGMRGKSPGDAQVLAALIAIDTNEILAANVALTKKISDKVKSYATKMTKEHDENAEDTEQLSQDLKIKPMGDSTVAELKRKGTEEVSKLSALDGSEFEKAYIDAMVRDHTDALAMIDGKLMTASLSPDVKKHLQETRDHVAKHLDEAKSLMANTTKQ